MKRQRQHEVTVESFLAGEPIEYDGFKRKVRLKLSYQMGVGCHLTSLAGKDLGTAKVLTDKDARRLYHNLTRKPPNA